MPFSAFLRRSFVSGIITFVARSHDFPLVFPSLLLDRGHWDDIGCTSVYNMNWRSRPILTVNSRKFDPKNVHRSGKFPKEYALDHQELKGRQFHQSRTKKGGGLLTRRLSNDGAVDLPSNCDVVKADCRCGEGALQSLPFFPPLPFFPRPFC